MYVYPRVQAFLGCVSLFDWLGHSPTAWVSEAMDTIFPQSWRREALEPAQARLVPGSVSSWLADGTF